MKGPGQVRGLLHVEDVIAIYQAFTGRLAWLVCGTPRLSDMCECTHSQTSALFEKIMVARPGHANALPSG